MTTDDHPRRCFSTTSHPLLPPSVPASLRTGGRPEVGMPGLQVKNPAGPGKEVGGPGLGGTDPQRDPSGASGGGPNRWPPLPPPQPLGSRCWRHRNLPRPHHHPGIGGGALRFTHSRLLLLNFAHAEKLPSTKIRTLYFESQSFKSIISVFQVSQEQKLCYRSPSKLLGKVQIKRKMPEILFTPINNFPFTLLLCVLFSCLLLD